MDRYVVRICTGEQRTAYDILIAKLEGKKSFGRPRIGCKNNIRIDIKETSWKDIAWSHRSQDRGRCWNFNELNVYGSVHRKYIPIYIQQDTTLHILFYLEPASHVSGGTSTHHQESKQLYLQHLVFVTPLLLSAAIVEELELV
jgi:hypothetical protein